MNINHVVTSVLAFSIAAQTVAVGRASYTSARLRQTPQDDVVRITTNLVQADVIVTDKDGRRVADLRPEDFEIVEGGKKQQITHFSYQEFGGEALKPDEAKNAGQPPAGGAPTTTSPLSRSQVRRTFALVVDDLGLSFESFGFVRKALRSFVDERMLPGDLVAVIRTSSWAGTSQQFASDKRHLHAVINRLNWNPKGRGGLSPVTTLNEASAGSDFRDTVQFTEEAEESRAGLYSVGTFGAVGALAQSMSNLPGRKSLVFFSEAFRLFQAQGRNVQLVKAMQQVTDQANAASVSIYTVDASGLQTDQFEASDNPAARAYMMDPQLLANTASGPGGQGQNVNAPPRTLPRADSLSAQAERDSGAAFKRLQALSEQRSNARQESHSVLSFLAANTGGLFLNNRNDLGGALGRVAEDNSGYYLIGFRPDEASLDAAGRPRLRRLEIKVKRSGLKARTRSGYAAGAGEALRAKPRTREEQLAAALVSPFAAAEVGVRLTSLFGVEPDGAPYLRSLVHVDARALSFREAEGGKRQADLEMVAVAFGRDGGVVEQLSYPQTVTAENEEAYRRLVEQGLSYILNMPLKQGGPHQVRVAVRDNGSGKVGAATQYVEAPELEKKRLALSGIVVSGIPAGAGTSAVAAEGDARLGPAVRVLPRGTLLDYRYQIYNAQADAAGRPQVQTQMRLFRDGQQVFGGRVLPLDAAGQKDLKRLAAAGRLRLGPELTPGAYLLQVTVTDTLAPEKHRVATQWMDFEIVE
jgi:VWFA-related protein